MTRSLTLSWRRSLSYRNQSIDLQSKSMDWVLYDRDLRHERVNKPLMFHFSLILSDVLAANIYLFKVNNRNIRKNCEVCSKLAIQKHQNDAIDFVLVFLLLTLNIFHTFSSASTVDFEQVNSSWTTTAITVGKY